MPNSKIPRRPIPKFCRQELEIADLCARALWYGINYETGKSTRVSDARLLSEFASNFYEYHKNRVRFKPGIFISNINDLIIACGIKVLFRGIVDMNFHKGINSIYQDVYPEFLKAQKTPSLISNHRVGVNCLEKLSKGFLRNAKGNRLNLASRVLFFLSPNLHTFNMNNNVAKFFGLPSRPHYHYQEYFELFSIGLKTNQTKLSKYKLPPIRDGLPETIWNQIYRTDWWERRVLDLAVLIHASPTISIDPNLRTYIRLKIRQDDIGTA